MTDRIYNLRIVWDERKRRTNLDKHGLDFAELTLEFLRSAVVKPSKAGRFTAVGRLGSGIIVVAVIARLGAEAVSVVSLRPASRKERAYAPKA